MEAILAVLFIGVCAAFYFLPSIIGKDKKNVAAIFVLNLLLGWTVIGWIVALVWACTAEDPTPVRVSAPMQFVCPRCKTPLGSASGHCTNCGVSFAQKKCPDCAELIKADARKCRFCGCQFENSNSASA